MQVPLDYRVEIPLPLRCLEAENYRAEFHS